jgi:hypothetical protein
MSCATEQTAASSVMRFLESQRAKYYEIMRTGDATDNQRNSRAGAPTWGERQRIDAEMDAAIERIRNGFDAAMVARTLGVKPATFYARLRNRGLTVRKIQKS